MTSVCIRGAESILTMDDESRELQTADILIEGGAVVAVGKNLFAPGAIPVDAGGCVVTPGLVNTHHHLYQNLTRAVPRAQNALLFDWLRTLYPIWARFGPDHFYTSTQVGLAELALSGCSLSSDHLYVFPNGARLDDTIDAAATVGVRFQPTRG
ncbi:MAG: 8-oxoguanine deaminase, partial [Pseudomonadota bacterium]